VGALLQITDHGTGRSFLPAYDGKGNIAALPNPALSAEGEGRKMRLCSTVNFPCAEMEPLGRRSAETEVAPNTALNLLAAMNSHKPPGATNRGFARDIDARAIDKRREFEAVRRIEDHLNQLETPHRPAYL